MCVVDKCCYFIPLNLACVIMGISNFIISTTLTITTIVIYFNEPNMANGKEEQKHFIAEFLGLEFKMETANIILSCVAIISMSWMFFSILLVGGIIKNEPSLVLSYFSFGIILTILSQLTGLLLLLNRCWWLAFIVFILSTINIHFMVVVHSVYELMQKGKDFRFQRHHHDDENLIDDCFDSSITLPN